MKKYDLTSSIQKCTPPSQDIRHSGAYSKENEFDIKDVRIEVFFSEGSEYDGSMEEISSSPVKHVGVYSSLEVVFKRHYEDYAVYNNYIKIREEYNYSHYNFSINYNGRIRTLGDYRHKEIIIIHSEMFPDESGTVSIIISEPMKTMNGEYYIELGRSYE